MENNETNERILTWLQDSRDFKDLTFKEHLEQVISKYSIRY